MAQPRSPAAATPSAAPLRLRPGAAPLGGFAPVCRRFAFLRCAWSRRRECGPPARPPARPPACLLAGWLACTPRVRACVRTHVQTHNHTHTQTHTHTRTHTHTLVDTHRECKACLSGIPNVEIFITPHGDARFAGSNEQSQHLSVCVRQRLSIDFLWCSCGYSYPLMRLAAPLLRLPLPLLRLSAPLLRLPLPLLRLSAPLLRFPLPLMRLSVP